MRNGSEFAEPGEPFTLSPGYGRHRPGYPAPALTRFWEDSRCPLDVECVQAGQVQIAVTAASGGQRSTSYVLGGQTDQSGALVEPVAITHGLFTVTLLAVEPYPAQSSVPVEGVPRHLCRGRAGRSVPTPSPAPPPHRRRTQCGPCSAPRFRRAAHERGRRGEPAILLTGRCRRTPPPTTAPRTPSATRPLARNGCWPARQRWRASSPTSLAGQPGLANGTGNGWPPRAAAPWGLREEEPRRRKGTKGQGIDVMSWLQIALCAPAPGSCAILNGFRNPSWPHVTDSPALR